MNTKGIGTPENKEAVFLIYREFGGKQVPKIIEAANKRLGLRLSAPTLYAWEKEGGWAERMKAADKELAKARDFQGSFEERMMIKLALQIEKYERYFECLEAGRMDNQAMYAYTNLLKTVVELSRKVKVKTKKDPEELRRAADEILKSEYGIER
jgi:hypothetical protein